MIVTVDDTKLKAIADAIRAKNGTTETYQPSEMAGAIKAISGINEVTELPAESDIGTIYKIAEPKFVDVVYVVTSYNNYVHRGVPQSEKYYYVKTKPTENIAISTADGSVTNPYYVEDEDDVFFYIDGVWIPFSTMTGFPYKGTITNAIETTEDGYYAVLGTEPIYYEYVNEVENLIFVQNGTANKISNVVRSTYFFTIPTKTTEGILSSNMSDTAYFYYIEDENDIFYHFHEWRSASFNFGTNRGEITDIADATEDGYYILRNKWKRYDP